MIDQTAWDKFILANPVLFHVTPQENVESILRDGLRPGSDMDKTTRRDFFQTRKGRTYLIGLGEIPIVDMGLLEPRVFAVELAHLDPALVDPDEDMVAERFPGMVAVPPPTRKMDGNEEAPGQRGALAEWADTTSHFDRSRVTERSLTEGRRMAYRGVIPPVALSLMDTRSRVVTAFAGKLPEGLDVAVDAIPLEGGWRTEVERATSLAVDLAHGVRDAVQAETDICSDDAYSAIETSDRLRAEARQFSRAARFDEASALRHVADVIQLLSDLHDLPLSDVVVAVQIAEGAASLAQDLMNLTSTRPGYAKSFAAAALTKAEAVGPR
jgi:hypothetical protein